MQSQVLPAVAIEHPPADHPVRFVASHRSCDHLLTFPRCSIKSMVFVCEYCSAKFTDGSSRSRHVKETHLGRTYFCPCCPKKCVVLPTTHMLRSLIACCAHRISRATAFKNHVKKHGILEVIRGDKQTVSDFNLRHWLPKWFKADECSQLAHFTSECIEKMRREEMKNASRTKSSRKKGQDCFTAESQSPSADTAELYSCKSTWCDGVIITADWLGCADLPFHPVTEASSAASTPRLHNTPNSLTALAPMPLLTFSPVPPPPGPGGLTYEGYGDEEDLYPVTAWDYCKCLCQRSCPQILTTHLPDVSPHLIGSDLSSVVSTPALTAGSTASTRSSLVTTPTMSGATPAFVDASYASYAEKDLPPPYHLVVGNSNRKFLQCGGASGSDGIQQTSASSLSQGCRAVLWIPTRTTVSCSQRMLLSLRLTLRSPVDYAEHTLDSCAWPSTELSPLPLGTPPLSSYDMYDSQRKPSGGLFGAPAPAARGWRPPPYPEGPVQRIARSSLGPVSL